MKFHIRLRSWPVPDRSHCNYSRLIYTMQTHGWRLETHQSAFGQTLSLNSGDVFWPGIDATHVTGERIGWICNQLLIYISECIGICWQTRHLSWNFSRLFRIAIVSNHDYNSALAEEHGKFSFCCACWDVSRTQAWFLAALQPYLHNQFVRSKGI